MNNIQKVIDQLSSLQSLENHLELSDHEKEILSFKIDLLNRGLSRLQNNEFIIHVIGTMKSGKSTFINALLGRDILPNESAACTLVPVVIDSGPFLGKIEKVQNDNQSSFIQVKQIEKAFLQDIRDYRCQLEKGKMVNISQYRFSHPVLCLPESVEGVYVSLVDTPGPNEMKQFAESINLAQIFSNSLKESSLIIFVIDIQYYKEEENRKLLDSILSLRPDLKEHIIFILNKMDRLMEQKNVTTEGTVAEIKAVLADWGSEVNLVFPVSSKKALLSRLAESNNVEKLNIIQKLISLIKKKKSIFESYKQDFNEVLPLLQKEIDGKILSYKPDPEEYYEELFHQSNFDHIEGYIKSTVVDRHDEYLKMLNSDLVTVNQQWTYETVAEQIHLLDQKIALFPISEKKEKLDLIKKSIQYIHSFYDEKNKAILLKGISNSEIENELLKANKFSNYFSNNYMPSYSTDWVEYRYDSAWIDSSTTEPGYQKRRLEEYYQEVMREAADIACECVRSHMKKKKELIKKNGTQFADNLEKKLNLFYKQNGLTLKLPISKKVSLIIDETYNYHIPSCAPSLYIESKHRSKERLIFKGLGSKNYVSYRLKNVSDYKEFSRRDVERIFKDAATFISNSFNKAVEEQIFPSYKQQLNQVLEIFEERMAEVETELQSLEHKASELLKIKEKLSGLMDADASMIQPKELVDV